MQSRCGVCNVCGLGVCGVGAVCVVWVRCVLNESSRCY